MRVVFGACLVAALVMPGQIEAQAPVSWSWSGFGGLMKVEDYDDLGTGYGASLRRMKEGASADFAVDLAYYRFPTTSDFETGDEIKNELSSLGLTGSVIYQKPGSPWQLVGGAGYYNFELRATAYDSSGDEIESSTLSTDPELGYHIGVGRRLGGAIAVEARYVSTKLSYSADGDSYSDPLRMLTVFARFTLF